LSYALKWVQEDSLEYNYFLKFVAFLALVMVSPQLAAEHQTASRSLPLGGMGERIGTVKVRKLVG